MGKTKKSSISNKKTKQTKKATNYEKLVLDMADYMKTKPSSIFNPLYYYKDPVQHTIIRYNDSEAKEAYREALNVFGKYLLYDIPEVAGYYQARELPSSMLNKYLELEEISGKEGQDLAKKGTEGFTRGIARYVKINYKLKYDITNGFTKLWELLNMVPSVILDSKRLNIFHLAEAPGQWINAMNYYLNSELNENVDGYDWRATSLNAKHPENIKKYGKDIFGDRYGLIANNKKKWIWGEDNTGDITSSTNQKWFRDYCREWMSSIKDEKNKVGLVLGDGGLGGETSLELLEKLDLAQLITVTSVCGNGGNCIIKHFLPFSYKQKESIDANGFYTSLIFLYTLLFKEVNLVKPNSSSPNSSEFYVVGLGFIGKNAREIYGRLLDLLDNFEVNMTMFPEDMIPSSFVKQFLGFVKSITQLNDENRLMKAGVYVCMREPSSGFKKNINCDKYMSGSFVGEIQSQRFKKWVKKTNFD
jgi:23S rRNA U2552 (ribose-2'-O)-methylase RlmE/FtsJ